MVEILNNNDQNNYLIAVVIVSTKYEYICENM